ncbi:hypothetical protein ACWGKC_41840, partial [Streptomyces sp. NPDC054804]
PQQSRPESHTINATPGLKDTHHSSRPDQALLGVWSLALAMTATGVFVAPTLTTAYLLADEMAGGSTRTWAGAWVNAAVNAGSSAGPVAAGLVLGRLPLGLCFALVGATALTSAAAVAAVTRPRP